jgi:hypothetical protein
MKISKETKEANKALRNYKDPFDYLLSLKETGRAAIHDDLENMNKSATKLITSMNVQTESNIAESIRNLIDSKVIVPKDMKIDDADLPEARNFYEWVTEDRFGTIGDERPFLEQLIWGLVTFNDVCYNNKCTDLEWLLHSHKVDDTYSKLERKVSLLHNGVCPNCGKGRSQMIKKGKMPFYNELAINAGQRCVIGSTSVFTSQGMEHMDEISPDAPVGFSEFYRYVYNGKEMEVTSHFFRAEPEPIIRVQTAMGFRVSGTHDHPIFVNETFTKLKDVKVGDTLTVQYGQRIFGKGVIRQAETVGAMFYNTVVPRAIRIADEESTTAFLQGLFRQGNERVFLAKPALQDISSMLLNAGYPHQITGVSITLTDEQLANLRAGKWSVGTHDDSIALVTDGGYEATYDFTLPETHQFLTGAILSHNSGKSHTVGTYMFPYLIHRLLKLQKPAQFYGLSRTTMLQGTFAALTYTQAKDTLWTPFFGALTETRWYKEYHSMLRHYEGVYGETLFKLTDTFVDYRVRGLQCVVGSTIVETERGPVPITEIVLGDRVKGLDGYNRVCGWHSNGEKHVYTLKTKNGFELTGTGNHPILSFDADKNPQWVELDKLKPGDFIAVAPKEFGTVKALYEEVESVTDAGRQNVYDITVDVDDHAFVANGIIQHNCFPMGPDKRVMRGRTRFGFSIDEIAYFDAEKDSGKVKINAFEVYDALANSLATVRTAADALIERGYDDVLPAYAMNVSSPTAKNDMIHVLLERAVNSRSMYGIHRATWDVNPNFKRNSTFIVEAYRKDPESAEKNFGANPPLIANPFLANHDFIMRCEDPTRKNACKIKPVYRNSKRLGQSYIYGKVEKVKKSGKASLMAIDAGVTDNSFSLVGGTTDGFNLSIDLVCEIIPLPGYRLNHSLIYSDVILPLMQARNCKVLLADRWNSIKLLDDAAADMGDPEEDIPTFIAKQYSLKYVDMVGVRTRMEQGNVSIPKSEIKVKTLVDAVDSDYRDFYQDKPIAHLFKQMFTIKDQLKGVGKGDGYTDDNWRAMALCLWGLQVEDYTLLLSEENFDGAMARPNALAASKLAMGAGVTVGNASGGQTMINGAPIALFAAGRR